MSPKDRLAEALYRLGLTRRWAAPASDQLIVFGYHRIRPDDEAFETPYDDGVYGPTLSGFREQMQWLRRHTRILSEDQLIDLVESGRPLPGPCSAVTFDDGYLDNYHLALPVLRELEIPATFFIPTRLIEERRLGWWDLIPYFLKKTARDSVVIDGKEHAVDGRAIDEFHDVMKLRPAAATATFLERLSAACEVPFPTAEEQDAELMGWTEIREAARQGVTIGSHSHTHRVLKTLDADALEEELRLSKTCLESEIGSPVRTLAYPCGSYQHFDGETRGVAAEAGYRLGFSFNTGVNRGGDMERFDIRRLGASQHPGRLAAIAVFPKFFSWPA